MVYTIRAGMSISGRRRGHFNAKSIVNVTGNEAKRHKNLTIYPSPIDRQKVIVHNSERKRYLYYTRRSGVHAKNQTTAHGSQRTTQLQNGGR
jgi:ribosomal protein L19